MVTQSQLLVVAAEMMEKHGYNHTVSRNDDVPGCFIHHLWSAGRKYDTSPAAAIVRLKRELGHSLSEEVLESIEMNKEHAVAILKEVAAQVRVDEQTQTPALIM